MCINPGVLADGQLVGCRKCWQCKELRINDWVGRNIAESKTAKHCHFVTLTYGRKLRDDDGKPLADKYGDTDHARAAVLTYSDVQKFFKKLRKAGHEFRYFAIGEYGAKKARSHWHILMYWRNEPPKFNLDVREDFAPWGHGFAKWESIKSKSGAVRYACKYIQKDLDDPERQGHIAMSKKPPLGTTYFQLLAQKYVEQGLAPQKLTYGWPDVVDKKGKRINFMMRGVVAENFVIEFERRWKQKYGEKSHTPWSEEVQNILDRIVRRLDDGSWELYKAGMPWRPKPAGAGDFIMHKMFQKWYVVADEGRFFWSYNERGEHAWIAETDEGNASDASE